MMNPKTAKKFAAVVALLLAGIMIFSALSGVLSVTASAASISGLKKQLSTIDEQKAEIEAQLEALESQINTASEKKAKLDEKMGLTQDEIDTTQALISQLTDEIDAKTTQLDQAIADLDEKTALFETRIRVMYENGEVSYLDVLLASENFSDMLSRMEIVSQIMDYDKKVVAEYTKAKEDITDKKLSLETAKTEQVGYESALKQQYDALDSQKQQQQQIISDLNADKEQKEAEERKMEEEKQGINSEIERLSREAAEAARKAAQQSGSSSSTSTAPSSGTFTWPIPGYGKGSITSPYGYRNCPYHGRELHSGTDLGVPTGTPIVAAAAGTVVKSYMSSSYGNYTVIDHGGGVITAYAHQSKRQVSVGDKVTAGQQIGLVGSTGNSTGSHLHFEVYVNGSTVNPMQYYS